MLIDLKIQKPNQIYHLMANSIIPRPIAWIVTHSEVLNIAPFSYFTPLSSNPPTLIVSIGHKSNNEPKDTLKNLREYKKCSICMIDKEHLDSMHLSSKELDSNESELEVFDIQTQKILEEYPPIPKGIKIAFFGEYLKEVDLKGSKTIPVIIEVKELYIDDKIITDSEQINIKFDAIARVGREYRELGNSLKVPQI